MMLRDGVVCVSADDALVCAYDVTGRMLASSDDGRLDLRRFIGTPVLVKASNGHTILVNRYIINR